MKKRIAFSLAVLIGFFTGACYADDESEECLLAIERMEQLEDVDDLSEQSCRFAISYSRDPSIYGCTWGDPEYVKPSLELLAGLWEGNCRFAGHFPFNSQDIDSNQDVAESSNLPPNSEEPTASNSSAEGGVSGDCEGVADGEYLPTVPQPIDAYLGVISTGYSAYSAGVSAINLAESHQQAVESGDSSELFDNVYSLLWSAVIPLGDAIGMRDVFANFSQFTDDLDAVADC